MNLLLILIVPLLTALAILTCRNPAQVRWTAFTGSILQLALAIFLFFAFRNEKALAGQAQFLFEQHYALFPGLHINFHLGVDGISVAMILLTSIVVLAGVLVSWNIE